jgi:broad specificity phosphatase PhoE
MSEMSQQNINVERERETAEARAELLRRAEREGVRPLSFDEMLGDPDAGDPEKEDVDDFLALRREWREDERARGRR